MSKRYLVVKRGSWDWRIHDTEKGRDTTDYFGRYERKRDAKRIARRMNEKADATPGNPVPTLSESSIRDEAYNSVRKGIYNAWRDGYELGKLGHQLGEPETWTHAYAFSDDYNAQGRTYAYRCGYADGRKAWLEQCKRIAAEIANPSNPDEVEP